MLQVIHPLTIEQIGYADIPLRLKNVKNPKGNGTIIYPSRSSRSPTPAGSTPELSPGLSPTPGPGDDEDITRAEFMKTNGYHGEEQRRHSPTAITAKDNITVINIQSNGRSKPQAFLCQIAERLQRYDVMIHLICSSKQSISLAISMEDSDNEKEAVDRAVRELEEIGWVTTAKHMSIISVVGHKLRNVVGVDGKFIYSLLNAGVLYG